MPKKRATNKHLPKRVYLRSGTYYYVDALGKWNNLGRNHSKAMALHATFDRADGAIHTLRDLSDRYMAEISPLKAESTYRSDRLRNKELLKRYGHIPVQEITPRMIYQVMDKRSEQDREVSANRELALLSHMFKKAIRWGAADVNPCLGIERFKETPRERYITDDEYLAFREFVGNPIAAYMDLKLLTGLRQGDMLAMRRADIDDEGIHVTVQKTGRRMIIEWTPLLHAAVDAMLATHPKLVISMFVICTRQGTRYTADGFRAIWQRKMKSALKAGVLTERFREHDLRAKTGSDTTLEHASNLLAHLDRKTTERHYQRKPTKVMPLK